VELHSYAEYTKNLIFDEMCMLLDELRKSFFSFVAGGGNHEHQHGGDNAAIIDLREGLHQFRSSFSVAPVVYIDRE